MSITGIGLGFRYAFAEALLASEIPELSFLELHPENYVDRGGRFRHRLDQARERYPFITHGLTTGFGSLEPPDGEYLKGLRDFLHGLGTPFHSEHLCFSGTDGVVLHDLLPLPFTQASADHAARQFQSLRDHLELPLALENVSYYAALGDTDEMDEADFLNRVLEACDGRLLLDVNNVWVNSRNHGFDPYGFIDRLPLDRVVQIHVAGPSERPDGLFIDTHGTPVRQECHELLAYTLRKTGPKPVLLERDQNFPPFSELLAELKQLHAIYHEAVGTP